MTRIAIALENSGERGVADVLALKLARHLRDVGFACDIIEVPQFRVLQPPISCITIGRHTTSMSIWEPGVVALTCGALCSRCA